MKKAISLKAKTFKVKQKDNPARATSLEVRVETSLVTELKNSSNYRYNRKGEFDTFYGYNKNAIQRPYKQLVSMIRNGNYIIEGNRDKGIYIRFPGFYEDIDAEGHGRELRVLLR